MIDYLNLFVLSLSNMCAKKDEKVPLTKLKPEDKDAEKDLDKISFVIDALNVHGFFFHQKCISEISENSSWQVIGKEFPINLSEKSTNIDIVALRYLAKLKCHAIFECKKVDGLFKTWIFFLDKKRGENDLSQLDSYKTKNSRKTYGIALFDYIFSKQAGSTSGKPLYKTFLGRCNEPFIVEKKDDKLSVCYDACTLKLDYNPESRKPTHNPVNATKKNTIEDACFQVLLGSRGYARHICKSIYKSYGGDIRLEKPLERSIIFVPIVLTTATLMVCDTSSDNINLDTGTIKDNEKLSLKEVPWLLYNYRPTEEQLHSASLENGHQEHLEEYPHDDSFGYVSSIFFVNINSLQDFLKKLPFG